MNCKKKIALIAGCSHTVGSEIDGTEDSEFNRNNSFAAVLAKMVDREPVNIAINGATNATIARSILNWFDKNYDADIMDVFVIVGWTESCRLEIPWEEGKYYNDSNKDTAWFDRETNLFNRILFGWTGTSPLEKEVAPYFHRFMAENPILVEIMTANLILQIQYFLKSQNVKYLMCNTLHVFTAGDRFVNAYLKFIDSKYYYEVDCSQEQAFYWKYRNKGYINEKAEYWHHGIEPHQLFAQELYDFIKENKCLD